MANTVIIAGYLDEDWGEVLPGWSPARPKGVRGYGAEAYADPYGAGGPLSVVGAFAVGGQTVRIVFNEEPAHFSPAGLSDALNPANYRLSIVIGAGTVPNPVGVVDAANAYPSLGVRAAGQFGFDVRLDRPLALGLRYRIAARNILSRAGQGLGFPYGASFVGITQPARSRPRTRRTDNADFATDPTTGAWAFDESGDIALVVGSESLRQRVVRRVTTVLDSYTFLKGYGSRLRIKGPITLPEMAVMQTDLRRQIAREPEVEEVGVRVTLVPLPGILTLSIQVRAKQGSLAMALAVQADGRVVIT